MSDEAVFSLPKAEVRVLSMFLLARGAHSQTNLYVGIMQLIALFTESLVFGAFTVLYGIAIWILLYRERVRKRSNLNRALFGISSMMWLLSLVVRLTYHFTRSSPPMNLANSIFHLTCIERSLASSTTVALRVARRNTTLSSTTRCTSPRMSSLSP